MAFSIPLSIKVYHDESMRFARLLEHCGPEVAFEQHPPGSVCPTPLRLTRSDLSLHDGTLFARSRLLHREGERWALVLPRRPLPLGRRSLRSLNTGCHRARHGTASG